MPTIEKRRSRVATKTRNSHCEHGAKEGALTKQVSRPELDSSSWILQTAGHHPFDNTSHLASIFDKESDHQAVRGEILVHLASSLQQTSAVESLETRQHEEENEQNLQLMILPLGFPYGCEAWDTWQHFARRYHGWSVGGACSSVVHLRRQTASSIAADVCRDGRRNPTHDGNGH